MHRNQTEHPSPSPSSESGLKDATTCRNMLRITIDAELDKADMDRLNLILPKEIQQLFFNNVLGDMLKELLYDNPELLNSYLKRAAQLR